MSTFGLFYFYLQAAGIFAWDLQFIQRILPQVFFSSDLHREAKSEQKVNSRLPHMMCIARVPRANKAEIRIQNFEQRVLSELKVLCKTSETY